jgi:hypothetical protein
MNFSICSASFFAEALEWIVLDGTPLELRAGGALII